MEEKLDIIPIFKQVSDGFKNVTVYVTKDGKEFKSKESALKHEAKLLSVDEFTKKYRREEIYVLDNDYTVLYIEELTDDVKREIGFVYKHLYCNFLKEGINLIDIDDSGDYYSESIVSITELIDELQNDLEILTELIKKVEE